MIFPVSGVFCKAPVEKQTIPFPACVWPFQVKNLIDKNTGKMFLFVVWMEESYRCKFVDFTVAWGDWPSAHWVEIDSLSVITLGTLIAFSNSDGFVCLSCSKKLSTTCASSSRTLEILREYLRLCHSFRWVCLHGGEIQVCGLCVYTSCLSVSLFHYRWLITVAFPWVGLQVGSHSIVEWVVLEVSQNYVLGVVFSFALHSKTRELCKSEPNQELAWSRSLWLT